MDVSYDRFIRTTDDYHVKSVQKIFTALHDKGDIYKSTYKGHVLQALRELLDRGPAEGRLLPRLRRSRLRGRGGSLLLQDQQVRRPSAPAGTRSTPTSSSLPPARTR